MSPSPERLAREALAEGRTAETRDGRRLAYAAFGDPDGAPVFVFHGFPNSGPFAAAYHDLACDLGLFLVSPSRPGLAGSDSQSGRTVVGWTRDVSDLADALRIDEFGVCGVSAGGPYALACAAELDRVHAASVAVGLGPLDSVGVTSRIPFLLGRYAGPVARLAIWARDRGQTPAERWETFLDSLEPDDATLLESEAGGAFRIGGAAARESGTRPLTGELAALGRPWGFDLADVGVPVRLRYGADDDIVPLEMGEALAARLPSVDFAVIADGSHFSVPIERARELFEPLA
jgi:pimeloyl-ACP methyl ester carboxylesterase